MEAVATAAAVWVEVAAVVQVVAVAVMVTAAEAEAEAPEPGWEAAANAVGLPNGSQGTRLGIDQTQPCGSTY